MIKLKPYLIAIMIKGMAFAQPDTLWTRTYGGTRDDWGYSVQQTTDNGYIIVGETGSYGAGSTDVYLIKTDADGDTLWTRTFGGTGRDYGYSVRQTTDGGYIIAGWTFSYGAGGGDVYLIKTDANGDTLWTRTFGGQDCDCGWSVQQTTDNGYIIVGTTFGYGGGRADVYLIRTDADGDTLWTRTFGGVDDDYGYSVQQTSDNGYIITGYTKSYGVGGDLYLIRTDADGDTLWTKTFGGPAGDCGWSVQQTTDNGYIITGVTTSYGAGENDVYLIKTEPDMRVEESKSTTVKKGFLTVDPNPSPGPILIRYYLPEDGSVTLTIYNCYGQRIATLLGCGQRRGSYTLRWKMGGLSSGIYFLRLKGAGFQEVSKVVLITPGW
ncbi:hypothetical protein DRP53_09495 [candidate division WOR-3 bacterium]|uniref:T9SS type A sorting domain-containing protein n=1 Tax=candidate division WOR-3 bacterium TaxID=2052148 RepID=A0A660SE83_UNCW3|nr:MAG: hypothetical protein DRP53_09495 [candidate division WOR-3 bacterium]